MHAEPALRRMILASRGRRPTSPDRDPGGAVPSTAPRICMGAGLHPGPPTALHARAGARIPPTRIRHCAAARLGGGHGGCTDLPPACRLARNRAMLAGTVGSCGRAWPLEMRQGVRVDASVGRRALRPSSPKGRWLPWITCIAILRSTLPTSVGRSSNLSEQFFRAWQGQGRIAVGHDATAHLSDFGADRAPRHWPSPQWRTRTGA